MTDADAFTILDDAHQRCGTEDMRTTEVLAALSWLQCQATMLTLDPELWPFDQFRRALDMPLDSPAADVGRRQLVNASINGIRRVCQIRAPRP